MIMFPAQLPSSDLASRLDLKLARRSVAVFGAEEIPISRKLGAGHFSQVYEINAVPFPNGSEKQKDSDSGDDEQMLSDPACEMEDKELIFPDEALVTRTSPCGCGGACSTARHYALKRLKSVNFTEMDAVSLHEHQTLNIALRDFLAEADLLSKLPLHPNIIEIVALSRDFFQCPGSGFMVLEYLEETLECRLMRQKKIQLQQELEQQIPMWRIICSTNARDQQRHHLDSFDALGIAKALQHLHHHNIIYRDLKPANIGYSSTGAAKLFDMGLARTCTPDKRLTGGAGTLRYMAPEVASHEFYDLSADVYSLGLLMWQICTLQTPMSHITKLDDWYKIVVELKRRPSVTGIALPKMRKLTSKCWQVKPKHRPSMDEVVIQLEDAKAVRNLCRQS